MEFDTNDTNMQVTDEQRRLAASKKMELQPMHSNVAPEGQTDAEIAAHYLIAPPIASASNDTEQNIQPIMPSKELVEASPLPKRHVVTLISITAVITLAAASVCGFVVWWLLSL